MCVYVCESVCVYVCDLMQTHCVCVVEKSVNKTLLDMWHQEL